MCRGHAQHSHGWTSLIGAIMRHSDPAGRYQTMPDQGLSTSARLPAPRATVDPGAAVEIGEEPPSQHMRPRVIYDAKPGSPLEVDRELYGRLARETGKRTPGRPVRRAPADGPGVAGACRADLPDRRRRGAAGGGSERVEPGEPARAVLGVAHAPAPPGAPHALRPAVVVPAVPQADADDDRRQRPATGATRTAAAVTTCSGRGATRTSTSCSTARSSTSAVTAISCARSRRFT